MWTRFMDMHSGGSCKQKPYEYIYIEAPEAEAKVIFYNRFGHNPERVTCTCCGDDYSIEDYDTLERATAYDRGCQHGRGNDEGYNLASAKVSVDDYVARPDVLVVPEADIKPQERTGEVPVQGYVWQD
jgi:hypothetical protein